LGKDLKPDGHVLVAADEVGAGFGEMVIVTRGAPAMQAFDKEKPIPIDAVVVGIVDNLEMAGQAPGKDK
jgi:ethanolamine utilization protein EutN